MKEELLKTVTDLYCSEIDENINLADNILKENDYDGRQASIIYNSMFNSISGFHRCMLVSNMFFILLESKERLQFEEEYKAKFYNENRKKMG